MTDETTTDAAPDRALLDFLEHEGITLESRTGPKSGKPLYKIADFEMPYMSTPEAAVSVYKSLKEAMTRGYFISRR